MTTKKEQAANLAEWLNTLPTRYVACRDFRHQWSDGNISWSLGHGHHGRVLACRRCGVRKEQIVNKHGQIAVSRMIDYPDDYKKPTDTPAGRVDPQRIRMEMFNRAVEGDGAPAELVALFKRITGK